MPLPLLPPIATLHDHATLLWHQEDAAPAVAGPGPAVPTQATLTEAILAQHHANFELWHIEDAARRPDINEVSLAATKRAIDQVNQRRNDLAEGCDTLLLSLLGPHGLPRPEAELHSESPGLMIDRLSILALKIFHTREEVERPDAPEGHAARNRQRLTILIEQRADLQLALERFWERLLASERSFKVYRQLKMYNDPDLNPAVYNLRPAAGLTPK